MNEKNAVIVSDEADSQLARLVEDYLAALEAGAPPDKNELLAKHPELADELEACLASLDFIRRAAVKQMAPDTDSAGSRQGELSSQALGDYRIVREIGRGGMGIVYEAQQISLHRRVALKVLPFAAVLDQRQLQRFKNEAQAAAGLHHQNIVPVHSVGCERGVHYYAMQYIEGHTLAELIDQLRRLSGLDGTERSSPGPRVVELASELTLGRFEPPRRPVVPPSSAAGQRGADDAQETAAYAPVSETPAVSPPAPGSGSVATNPVAALSTEHSTTSQAYFRTVANLGVQAAEALEYAHEQGVLHRDIKPSNLLLDTDGHLWVTDFGLARVEANAGMTMTMTGDVMGTLRYMSPEQALAKRVMMDQRTDIYSLGVTLYELLTLQPAFAGRDRQELLRQIAFEEPRAPRRLNRAVPADLETIVTKAMAKDPAERYDTANDLAADLERFLEHKPIRAKRPSLLQRGRKWSRRHRTMLATVFLSVLVAWAASSVWIWRERVKAVRHRNAAEANLVLVQKAKDQEAELRKEAVRQREEVRRAVDEMYEAYGLTLDTQQKLSEQFPDVPEYREALAFSYYSLGKALERDPDRLEASYQAYEQALALQEELVADFPDVSEHRNQLRKWCRDLGLAWMSRGRLGKAEEALRRRWELAEQRNEPALLCWPPWDLGLLVHLRGRSGEAADLFRRSLDYFEKAAAARPEKPDLQEPVVWCLATCPVEELRDPGRAVELARRLVQRTPDSSNYWHLLGMAQYRAGQWSAAIEALRRSMELPPDEDEVDNQGRVRLFLAMAHWQLGEREQARTWYDDAVQFMQEDEKYNDYDLWHRFRVEAEGVLGLPVTASTPEQPAWQAVVRYWELQAQDFENQANQLRANGQHEEAEEAYREELEFRKKLAEEFPEQANHQVEVAQDQANLAELLRRRGQLDAALDSYGQALATCQKLAADFPDAPRYERLLAGIHHCLASLLQQVGRRDEAETHRREAARLALAAVTGHPDAEALKNQAWKAAGPNSGGGPLDAGWAVELANKAVELRPEVGDYWSKLGVVQYRAGDWQEAIESLRRSTDLTMGGFYVPVGGFVVSMAHWQLGHEDPARRWYAASAAWLARMQQRGEKVFESPRLHSEAAALLGVPESAPTTDDQTLPDELEIYGLILEADPDAAWAYLRRGQLYERNAQSKLAEADYQKAIDAYTHRIEADPDAAWAYQRRAQLHEQEGKSQEADADYQRAVAIWTRRIEGNPEHIYVRNKRGLVHYKAGRWNKAVADFSKAVELEPEKPVYWSNRGFSYANLSRWEEAAADFSKAVELKRGNHRYWYLAAMAQLAAGDAEGFRKTCAGMLEQFRETKNAAAAHDSAWTCVLAPDAVADFALPIQLAERALASKPKEPGELCNLGAVMYRAGRFEEALSRLNEADALVKTPDAAANSSPAYKWFFLATTHHRLGHADQARAWLDKAGQWTEKVLEERPEGAGGSWNRRLTLQLLRQETEELMGIAAESERPKHETADSPAGEEAKEPSQQPLKGKTAEERR